MRSLPLSVFAATCLVAGSTWLVPGTELTIASALAVQAISCAALAILSCALLLARTPRTSLRFRSVAPLVASGTGVVGLPLLLVLLGRQQLSSVMEAACGAAVPVIVAVAQQASSDSQESLHTTLGPAVLGFGGALLLLPVALPGSLAGWTGLVLYLLAACTLALSSIACHRQMQRLGLLPGLFVIAVANTLFALVAGAVAVLMGRELQLRPELAIAAQLVLGLCLTAGIVATTYLLQPVAAATRLLFVLMIASAEAWALMRPTISIRMLTGAGCMLVGGSALLWRGRANAPPETLSLR